MEDSCIGREKKENIPMVIKLDFVKGGELNRKGKRQKFSLGLTQRVKFTKETGPKTASFKVSQTFIG